MKTTTLKKPNYLLADILKISLWIVFLLIYLLTVKPVDTVVFLDVGQGDATLIQKGNIQLLVDGGSDISILYELQKYIPFYDRKIEYVLLTHPHDDHLVGLLYVLDTYEVGEILYYPVCFKNPNYELLISNEVKKREVKSGTAISLANLEINIVWPRAGERSAEGCLKPFDGNINNDSVVIDFEYINRRFLLMGDAEKEVEKILISDQLLGKRYDILKAGHHCSKTSSSETFLKNILPAYAICSVGEDNKFGHPSSETLNTFDSLNVQYLVTYEEGNIQIK
ncbi:MAG: MBL fold metallo-hydrolase [Candidatus Dojkabacteria bacterium]|jgi:competence protein ComEC